MVDLQTVNLPIALFKNQHNTVKLMIDNDEIKKHF